MVLLPGSALLTRKLHVHLTVTRRIDSSAAANGADTEAGVVKPGSDEELKGRLGENGIEKVNRMLFSMMRFRCWFGGVAGWELAVGNRSDPGSLPTDRHEPGIARGMGLISGVPLVGAAVLGLVCACPCCSDFQRC